jgi:hypothetical protein
MLDLLWIHKTWKPPSTSKSYLLHFDLQIVFLSNVPLKEYITCRVFPPAGTDISDPAARKRYVTEHMRTAYHPTRTTKLGRGADEKLNVIGVVPY